MKILALFFLMFLTACDQEGGGVIVTQSPPPVDVGVPQSHSGNPGIPDDALAGLPADPRPYTFDELQTLVYATPAGGTLELTKDAELFGQVIIDRPMTVTSSSALGRNALIKSYSGSPWVIQSDNIVMHHLSFDLYNNIDFASGSLNSGIPTYNNLSIDHLIVKLRGRSSMKVTVNGFIMRNSTILGLTKYRQTQVPMMSITGNNFSVLGNTLFDVYDNYEGGLFLIGNQGGNVSDNVIRVFAEPFRGAISLRQVDNITLSRNILYDRNTTKTNSIIGNDLQGAVAISLESSNNVRDNSSPNLFNANYFTLIDVTNSTNINLTPGASKTAYTNGDLFNNLVTEDFTPICLPTNATFTNQTPKPFLFWQDDLVPADSPNLYYQNVTIYYAGAIRPACH